MDQLYQSFFWLSATSVLPWRRICGLCGHQAQLVRWHNWAEGCYRAPSPLGCLWRKDTHTHKHTQGTLSQASKTTISNSAKTFFFFYDVYKWLQIYEQQGDQWDIIHGWLLSRRAHVAACGTRWHVVYLLFSMINAGEEVDAIATQAEIISHNKTLKLMRKERVRGGESQGEQETAVDVTRLITGCY